MTDNLIAQEEHLEIGAVTEAVARYRKKLQEAKKAGDLSLFNPELRMIMENAPRLAKAIEATIAPTVQGKHVGFRRQAFGDIDSLELAVLTIRHCFNHCLGNESIQKICILLADDIRVHKDDLRFKEDFAGYRAVVQRSIKSAHQGHKNKVMAHVRHKMGIEDTEWTKQEKMSIGKTLIDLFIDTCGLFYLDTYRPLTSRYEPKLKRKVLIEGVSLYPTKYTAEWLEKNHKQCEIMAPVLKPMVVPPVPWTSPVSGGYVSGRFADGYSSCRLIKGASKQSLREQQSMIDPQVYMALNKIQEVPYRINKRVLDIVEELRLSGLAGLPDGKPPVLHLKPKPWPDDMDAQEWKQYKKDNLEQVREWCIESHKVYQKYWEEKSKRTTLIEKLRLAQMFKDYEAIYFPMNLDWRGRIYQMSTPVLSFQGDDPSKGMLEFAEGKPVTDAGLRELRIHGANVYGKDKLSEKDRVGWVLIHTGYILEVAENPFGESQMEFWTKADKPFQFLAFCFDYAGFLTDPENHKSHLICHIDQTCSGLQHWSAVLQDGVGGAQVGMVDKPMPDDIYQVVADKVEEMIADDPDPIAVSWRGKVSRTITKRNVMTKLYSATMPGMRDQVVKELKDLDKKAETGRYLEGCPVENFQAAQFIATKNNQAMKKVVAKATKGMDYVQACTKLMAQNDITATWVSPIGLPVRQTYWKSDTKRVQTYWISLDIEAHPDIKLKNAQRKVSNGRNEGRLQTNLTLDVEGKIKAKKSCNSIAPNFIHSMDASHLLFISLAWDKGLTVIHDSFGTHCSDIPELHAVVRQTFVNMYKDADWLYEFARSNSMNCPEVSEIKRPSMGNMDFDQILSATYFCR